ncbi:MAG TPA: triose-phosphate isomerase [Nitrososphaeraceae archaeon]
MTTFRRPLVINMKNYLEIGGPDSLKLATEAKDIADNHKIEIVLAPPQNALLALSMKSDIPLICQHVDNSPPGASTGFIVPEIAKSCGAIGSLINHSEHRTDITTAQLLIHRLRRLNMISIVCAKNIEEIEVLSRFSPDFVAIEPPELIGTGIAISKANPSIIVNSVKVAKQNSSHTGILCGAGIVEKSDVEKALDLGVDGILVASGIVKAIPWSKKILELGSAMK